MFYPIAVSYDRYEYYANHPFCGVKEASSRLKDGNFHFVDAELAEVK